MPELLQKIKLPDTGIVADVGGGFGHTLLEFLKAKPMLTGIVFELPSVASRVEEGLKDPCPPGDSIYSKYSAEVKTRASVVAGSYTDGSQLKTIAHADVFFLKWIFHDNNDTVFKKILTEFYETMKPTAKIIIADTVLKLTPNEWKFPVSMDMNMALTLKGKERTKDEWTRLFSNGEDFEFDFFFGNYAINKQFLEMDLITLTKRSGEVAGRIG